MINVPSFTKVFRVLAVWTLLLTTPSVFAAVNENDKAKAQELLAKAIVGFEENKGQFIDQNNQPNNAVRYLFRSPGLNVQLRNNGFSYDSYKDEVVSHGKKESPLSMMHPAPQGKHKELSETQKITRHFHRVDIELVGAASQPEITANSALTSTNNYYTHDQVIENVQSYETVMYKNVYPNIDLEFFISAEGKPEYQFYVRPGGDAKLIRLRYNGALNTRLAEGKIIMDVAHGSIAEHIPLSYLASSKQEVTVQYRQTGKNEFGCNVPSYPSTETIIIDPMPELSWGTYYGGSDDDNGKGIAVDGSNNVYVTGWTRSTNNIATVGAHQTTYNGSYDAFIAKFSTNGVRLWGTYYGGGQSEDVQGIAVDGSGNVYVTGSTSSTFNISTVGAHQTTNAGGGDVFIVKFNTNGVRLWATYYGGSASDGASGIAVDGSGNVYVTGSTSSTFNISTVGAHQTTNAGGGDVFIVKFNTNGVRLWATYYGGSASDGASGIAVDGSNNVYVTGITWSPNNIATTGAHQTTLGSSDADAFIIKFTTNGTRLWGTYYGGLGSEEGAGIAVDGSNNVYVTGYTSSTNNIATTGAHQTTNGGNPNTRDVFIAKFNTHGVRLWATYYGGSASDGASGIAVDGSNNVYVTGYTSSTNNIATAGAHQATYGGGISDAFIINISDAFIIKFSTNGVRLWGTYYGGNDYEYPGGITVDGSGNVYVTGVTKSTNNIATAGAHQTSYGGGDFDAFIAKFTQGNDIIWLKAEDAGTVDNSAVSQWQDQSGNDDNAVQNNSGSRPFYRNNGNDNINGHPVVGFSFGRALSMAGREQVNGGNAKTFFVVFRTGSNTLSRQVLVDLGGLSSGFNMYIQNSRLYAGAWDNTSWWVNTIVTSNRTYLAQFVYDGTRLRLSLSTPGLGTTINESNFSDNFITALITGNGVGSAFQQTRYHNGINIAAGHSDFFTDRIAEIIVLNSADLNERTEKFQYLNAKYAIGETVMPLQKSDNAIEEESEPLTYHGNTLSVLPNPVQTTAALYYGLEINGYYHVSLQDLLGNTVMTIAEGTQKAGTYTAECNTEGLSSGMYRLVLTTATGTISTPMVIQR